MPMLNGMVKMREVLGQAGHVAEQDFRRELPPVNAMATVASLFKPLSWFGRSVAATSLMLIGAALPGGLAWRAVEG